MKILQMVGVSLLRAFAIAFCLAGAVIWFVQELLVSSKTADLMEKNRTELRQALIATSDARMLGKARRAAELLPVGQVSRQCLSDMLKIVGADEIHLCDANAVIVETTVPEYLGMDFHKHAQTKPFCDLLHGQKELAQDFGPIAYNSSRYRKYVAVALDRGGFLQLGFDEDRYLPTPDLSVWKFLPTIEVLLVLLVVFVFVYVYVQLFLRERVISPIRRANASLSRISASDFDEKVLAGGSTELDSLADDINVTVDRLKEFIDDAAHRTTIEQSTARSIQTSVLPTVFPPYPNLVDKFDLFALMQTAKEVGGDFYDFYFVDPDHLALVIADVSGKGIASTMFMMRAKTALQGFLKSELSIVEAVVAASDRLADSNENNMFVTAWVGVVNIRTGDLEYVNAGHNPPLIVHGGEVSYLRKRSGPPLASLDEVKYSAEKLCLAKGDGILLYTDGVTETVNGRNEKYGEERLLRFVRGLRATSTVERRLNAIVEALALFAHGAERTDDITLLGFCRK